MPQVLELGSIGQAGVAGNFYAEWPLTDGSGAPINFTSAPTVHVFQAGCGSRTAIGVSASLGGHSGETPATGLDGVALPTGDYLLTIKCGTLSIPGNYIIRIQTNGTFGSPAVNWTNLPIAQLSLGPVVQSAANLPTLPFGNNALALDGTPGCFVSTPDNAAFLPGTGDFTWELRFVGNGTNVNQASGTGFGMLSDAVNDGTSTFAWSLYWIPSDDQVIVQLNSLNGSGGVSYSFATNGVSLDDDTVHALAIVRKTGQLTMYVDGIASATGSQTSSDNIVLQSSSEKVMIGSVGSYQAIMQGWIKEVRISSSARYSTGYIPSTGEFSSDGSTVLLVHFDGKQGLSATIDSSSNSFPLTFNGNAVMSWEPAAISGTAVSALASGLRVTTGIATLDTILGRSSTDTYGNPIWQSGTGSLGPLYNGTDYELAIVTPATWIAATSLGLLNSGGTDTLLIWAGASGVAWSLVSSSFNKYASGYPTDANIGNGQPSQINGTKPFYWNGNWYCLSDPAQGFQFPYFVILKALDDTLEEWEVLCWVQGFNQGAHPTWTAGSPQAFIDNGSLHIIFSAGIGNPNSGGNQSLLPYEIHPLNPLDDSTWGPAGVNTGGGWSTPQPLTFASQVVFYYGMFYVCDIKHIGNTYFMFAEVPSFHSIILQSSSLLGPYGYFSPAGGGGDFITTFEGYEGHTAVLVGSTWRVYIELPETGNRVYFTCPDLFSNANPVDIAGPFSSDEVDFTSLGIPVYGSNDSGELIQGDPRFPLTAPTPRIATYRWTSENLIGTYDPYGGLATANARVSIATSAEKTATVLVEGIIASNYNNASSLMVSATTKNSPEPGATMIIESSTSAGNQEATIGGVTGTWPNLTLTGVVPGVTANSGDAWRVPVAGTAKPSDLKLNVEIIQTVVKS